MPTVSRRLVIQGLASLVGAMATRPAAAAGAATRKTIFVFASGGWDPLAVFAPIFDSPHVDPSDGGEPATAGGLRYVDHPNRPAVRSFFERWHGSTAIINGISVPSLSHDVCTRLVLTGLPGEGRPDWPSSVGAARAADFSLPSLVVAGPSYPEAHGIYSARAGEDGQLARLVDGSILQTGAVSGVLPERLRGLVSDRVQQRAAAFAQEDPLGEAFRVSLERARSLSDATDPPDFAAVFNLRSQADLAVDALGRGVSRVVSLEADGIWDSHGDNEAEQSLRFDSLFRQLERLMRKLKQASGDGGSLLDETTVVVLSEMGRTPLRNGADGRDHWPYTSAMLLGAGVRGGQVVSGYDDGYIALGYDAATGATTPGGAPLTTEHLGATLLALADVDPASALPADVAPIAAVVA